MPLTFSVFNDDATFLNIVGVHFPPLSHNCNETQQLHRSLELETESRITPKE